MYVNVIETHGSYSTVSESAKRTKSAIKKITEITVEKGYLAFSLTTHKEKTSTFVVCTTDSDKNTKHKITINGITKEWVGPFINY